MTTLDFEFRLLRNGGEYGYLAAVEDQEATLRMRDTGEIKTSLAATFDSVAHDADGAPIAVDWTTDEIEPVMILDGTAHPLGIYAVAQMDPRDTGTDATLTVQAYDRCWRVQTTRTDTPVYFEAGTSHITAIEQLLTAAGITTVLTTPSDAVLPEEREWELAESYLTMVNELLGEINYKQLYFTAEGAAVLEPVSVPRAGAVRHSLTTRRPQPGEISDELFCSIQPGLSRSTDMFETPNVFIAVCANPLKGSPLVATAVNDNPQSPLSTVRRGRRICQKYPVDNIANQAELQAYAEKLRNDSLMSGETLTITTALIPGIGVGDVVSLYYDNPIYDIYGNNVGFEPIDAICVVRAWTMSLAIDGAMELELERVVYNLDV